MLQRSAAPLLASLLLAGGLGCQGSGSAARTGSPAETASEQSGLTKIVDAFKRFHDDTGGWPMGASAWTKTSATGANPQIDPIAFDEHDTALFTLPAALKHCGDGVSKPCWNGPYLEGTSLGDEAFRDAWGHPRLFTLIRPMDGKGGGVQSAPEGAVIIWSAGPDGIDSIGCTDASCARDWSLLALGQPSADRSDDVVTLVGKTAE